MTPKDKALSLLDKIQYECTDKNEKRRNSNLGLLFSNEILESFMISLNPDKYEYWEAVKQEFYKLNQESE
jgi:hypothetical protein